MKCFKKILSAVLTFALIACIMGVSGVEIRERPREPDWNEAGLRLQEYMEEYTHCREATAMLEEFKELFFDELVGFNPDIRADVLDGTSNTLNSTGVAFRCGDVDGNGIITLDDALAVSRYLIGQPSVINDNKRSRTAALVCRHRRMPALTRHTGMVGIDDQLHIQRSLIGLPNDLDTCQCGAANTNERFVVRFNSNGGSALLTRVVARNARLDSVGALSTPTRTGFVFFGVVDCTNRRNASDGGYADFV
jgi:hypothetical protein